LRSLSRALYLLAMGLLSSSVCGAPADSAEFFVANYGLAKQTQPLIARAYQVFDRVKAAAALPGRQSPELRIVDSPADPWAQALPDGNIILSQGAVDVCYREAGAPIGDTRLAFVLGHELAHLAKDDFWHSKVHRALAGEPGTESVRALLEATSDADPKKHAETRAKEAQADDWGVLYAGLAGYPVDQLLGDGADRLDFFRFWLAQTHTRAEHDPRHPPPEEREVLIRSRLSQVIGDLEYYRFGVRLLSFERFEEARYFLEAFAASFPAPEVLGNLGYLELRMAMREMPAKLAYRYWMPTLFDVTSRADRLGLPARGESLPPEARVLLERALEYLDKATAMDGDYLPAWINTAAARSYLGDMSLAMHAAREALRLSPDDADLEALQAVIIANLDPALDMWPMAIARLEPLVTADESNAVARYNLARLFEERGRTKTANEHWAWLRANAGLLPAPYYREVCADHGTDCHNQDPTNVTMPWDLPVQTGLDLYENNEVQNLLNGNDWQREAFDFQRQGMEGHFYWRAAEVAVLDLDGYVDMVVLYGESLGAARELARKLGEPASVQRVQGGELWSYGGAWMIVVRENQITEVWVASTAT